MLILHELLPSHTYTFTRAVRSVEADETLSRTPVIAWTANALTEEALLCEAAGMDDILVKPTDMLSLKTMLEKRLSADDAGILKH